MQTVCTNGGTHTYTHTHIHTHTHTRTYDTERFPGEAEASLPASVAAAAASAPYPDDVLQTKHDNHHKLLQDTHTHTHTQETHILKPLNSTKGKTKNRQSQRRVKKVGVCC